MNNGKVYTINNTPKEITTNWERWIDTLQKAWFRFSQNKLSVLGLIMVVLVILMAIFAGYITPFPEHAGAFVDFVNAKTPPNAVYFLGTDMMGRDVFSRIIFSFRGALKMAIIVLSISAPFGIVLGLVAGFFKGSLADIIIMRITDIFMALPSLILAMAVAAILEPNLTNAMLAISLSWWTRFTRLVYGIATSCRNEYYVINAELLGAGKLHILFREIFPNCISPVLTKIALDIGWVILNGASLSFLGLGEQAPTPSLGGMISEGYSYMPELWWLTIFPAIAIMLIIVGFNFLGDGIRDMLEKGDRA